MIEKQKPVVDQEVVVLFNGELYDGKVIEVFETPLGSVPFCFNVIAKDVKRPATYLMLESKGDKYIYSSHHHLEPYPDANIDWSNYGMFSRAFVFLSKESYEKWILDVKTHKRNYHLRQAELYK